MTHFWSEDSRKTTRKVRPARSRKRRLGRRLRNFLVGALGPLIVRGWVKTLRFRWDGDIYRENGMPVGPTEGIYVFWHQRMLAFAGFYRNSGVRVLISQHGDGEMIARVIARLGMEPIRGSSTRGGARAILELLRQSEGSGYIVITPDGPQGPRHVFQGGAIYLASRTGLPIYPVAVSFERYFNLRTWDGFLMPLPFTRGLFRIGKPLQVPSELERSAIEANRKLAEEVLRDLTDSADRQFLELWKNSRDYCTLPEKKAPKSP